MPWGNTMANPSLDGGLKHLQATPTFYIYELKFEFYILT